MIKICKERLEKDKDNLEKGIKLYYNNNRIHSYKDLFKIICIYLSLGNPYEIEEIKCQNHSLLITTIGRVDTYDHHIMTYINYEYEEYDGPELLELLIDEADFDDYSTATIISKLMNICIAMINNITNPYDCTGIFEKTEELYFK